jgi:hypothetical protein
MAALTSPAKKTDGAFLGPLAVSQKRTVRFWTLSEFHQKRTVRFL